MEPQSHDQWQEAVDAAHVLLLVTAAESYELVKTNFEINEDRCISILRRGKARGITPAVDAIERLVH